MAIIIKTSFRRHMSGFAGCLEFAAMLCELNLRDEVRTHPHFRPMCDAAGDAGALQNDIQSFPKEFRQGEQFNLILVKMNQGATPLEAFKEVLRCVWDATYQFIYFAELMLKEFPDDPDFALYLDITINMINGYPDVHHYMLRYPSSYGKIIKIKEFEDIDEQFDYGYNVLLKSDLTF